MRNLILFLSATSILSACNGFLQFDSNKEKKKKSGSEAFQITGAEKKSADSVLLGWTDLGSDQEYEILISKSGDSSECTNPLLSFKSKGNYAEIKSYGEKFYACVFSGDRKKSAKNNPYLIEISKLSTSSTTSTATGGSTSTASATATPSPGSPTAVTDNTFTVANTAKTIDVSANDTDPQGGALTVSAPTGASNGTLSMVGNQIQYTPNAAWTGTDSFTYTITNAAGLTATGTVNVYVNNPYTWTGASGDGLWSNTANWSTPAIPAAADDAIFNGGCGSNCTVSLDAAVNVCGFDIQSSFTGTINQAGNTVTTGSCYWKQASGTFNGSASAITHKRFRLSGGTYKATSGTLTISESTACCGPSQSEGFTISGGTYSHNNGTIQFTSPTSNWENYISNTWGVANVIDVNSSVDFYNMIVDARDSNATGGYFAIISIATGDTINVKNDFTMTSGNLRGGTINVEGNVSVTCPSGAGGQRCPNSESTAFNFVGSNSVTYTTDANAVLPDVTINKSGAATVTPSGGTTDITVNDFRVQTGSFTGPSGTMRIGKRGLTSAFDSVNRTTGLIVDAGATFNASATTIHFDPSFGDGSWGEFDALYVDTNGTLNIAALTITAVDTLYNVATSSYGQMGVRLSPTTILDVAGTTTFASGRIMGSGQIYARGNLVLQCADGFGGQICSVGGNGTIRMNNTTAGRTYSHAAGARAPVLVIDNSGQTVSALGGTTTIDVDKFNLVSGTFTAPTGNMTIYSEIYDGAVQNAADGFTVAAGTTYNYTAASKLIFAGTVYEPGWGSMGRYTSAAISVPNNFNLNHLEIAVLDGLAGGTSDYQGARVKLISGSLITNGTLTVSKGSFETSAGGVTALGNVSFTCAAGSVAAGNDCAMPYSDIPITFASGGAQSLNVAAGGYFSTGNLTVNKAGGTLSVTTDVTLGATSSFDLQAGTMSITAVHNVTHNGPSCTVQAGATLNLNGGSWSTCVLGGAGTINL